MTDKIPLLKLEDIKPKLKFQFQSFNQFWSSNATVYNNIQSVYDLKPFLFKVDAETFLQKRGYEKPLLKRSDKENFIDTIIFGIVISKKVNLESFKNHIRK